MTVTVLWQDTIENRSFRLVSRVDGEVTQYVLEEHKGLDATDTIRWDYPDVVSPPIIASLLASYKAQA
jgi:hypothetical protein